MLALDFSRWLERLGDADRDWHLVEAIDDIVDPHGNLCSGVQDTTSDIERLLRKFTRSMSALDGSSRAKWPVFISIRVLKEPSWGIP